MKRVLILSLRGLIPHPSRCGAFEFEDLVAGLESADFCVPRLRDGPPVGRWLHRATRALERSVRLTLAPAARVLPAAPLHESYELGLFCCQSLHDLRLLQAMPGWRHRCRRAVCWMDDLWSHSIREHPRALAPLRQFDLIVSTTRHVVNLLQQTMERPCFALPEGVDCFRFSPFPHPPDRSIDVFCLGRRSAETHQALVAQARARRLYYVYDSLRSNLMYEIDEHRDLIAHHVQRCRYFLVQSARANPPEKSEGREEVGNRYFEGCAGGAILVGEIPRSPTVAEYFAWPDAIVPYAHGSRRIVEFLAELDAQPERRAAIHRRNALESLLQHDWSYRWQSVLEQFKVDPPSTLAARQNELRQRASRMRELDQRQPLSAGGDADARAVRG